MPDENSTRLRDVLRTLKLERLLRGLRRKRLDNPRHLAREAAELGGVAGLGVAVAGERLLRRTARFLKASPPLSQCPRGQRHCRAGDSVAVWSGKANRECQYRVARWALRVVLAESVIGSQNDTTGGHAFACLTPLLFAKVG